MVSIYIYSSSILPVSSYTNWRGYSIYRFRTLNLQIPAPGVLPLYFLKAKRSHKRHGVKTRVSSRVQPKTVRLWVDSRSEWQFSHVVWPDMCTFSILLPLPWHDRHPYLQKSKSEKSPAFIEALPRCIIVWAVGIILFHRMTGVRAQKGLLGH